MRNITYIHGWGGEARFWDVLRGHLPPHQTHLIDLGYRNAPVLDVAAETNGIYVTHSLGTMWALRHHANNIGTLIVINGFHSFRDFVSPVTLRAMKRGVQQNPQTQMSAFFKQADLPEALCNWKQPELVTGLDMLAQDTYAEQLSSIKGKIIILAGENDQIISPEHMQKQWLGYDVKICEKGGHALPLTHPQWCAAHIIETLEDA